ATDKTQKPFLRRALSFYERVFGGDVADPTAYFRAILQRHVDQALRMSDKPRAYQLLDYFRVILPKTKANGENADVHEGLEWHNYSTGFVVAGTNLHLQQRPDLIPNTTVHQLCGTFAFDTDLL